MSLYHTYKRGCIALHDNDASNPDDGGGGDGNDGGGRWWRC